MGEISSLLYPELGKCVGSYDAKWADGSLAFSELRYENADGRRTLRATYYDPERRSLVEGNLENLSKFGLLIPANVPAMIAAWEESRKRGLKLNILLCGGWVAMEQFDKWAISSKSMDLWTGKGFYPVVSAWLAGRIGAEKTNFNIRPVSSAFVVKGRNDESFPVKEVRWTLVLRNNPRSKDEVFIVAERLGNVFGAKEVFICEPD